MSEMDTWYYAYLDPEEAYHQRLKDNILSQLSVELQKPSNVFNYHRLMNYYGEVLTNFNNTIIEEERDDNLDVITNSCGEEELDDYSSISSYHTSENEVVSSDGDYYYSDDELDDYWSDY